MQKFIQLTIDEYNRNKSFNLIFIGLLTMLEIIMIVIYSFNKIDNPNYDLTLSNFFYDNNLFFIIIGAGVIGILIFTWYSWYREWMLQGRHIYRLMTLPGSRIPIAWSKWAAISLMVMTMIAWQSLIMIVFDFLFKTLVNNYQSVGFKNDLVFNASALNLIIPANPLAMIQNFSVFSLILFMISNAQIIFLSYKSKSKFKAFGWTLLYLMIASLLLIASFAISSFYFNGSQFEANLILFTFIFILNLIHGSFMTWLAKYILSI